MKKNWIIAILLTCTLLLTGCMSKDETIYGQVKSVDNGSITINVGNKTDKFDKGTGIPPDMSSSSADTNPNTATTLPDSTATTVAQDKGTPPSVGNPPTEYGAKDSNMPPDIDDMRQGMLELTGEERTITVNDTTTVQQRHGDTVDSIKISQLKEGDMLEIVMKDDAVVSISLLSPGSGNHVPDTTKQQ